MSYKILEEKSNGPMNRKELRLEFPHSRNATVSKAHVQKAVAEQEKVPGTHIHVNSVKTNRGTTTSIADVEVYKEPKAKDLNAKEATATEQTAEPQAEAPAEKTE